MILGKVWERGEKNTIMCLRRQPSLPSLLAAVYLQEHSCSQLAWLLSHRASQIFPDIFSVWVLACTPLPSCFYCIPVGFGCVALLSLGAWGWHGLFAFRIRAQRKISAGTLERIDARFRLYRHCKVGGCLWIFWAVFSQEEIWKKSYLQDVGLRHSADLQPSSLPLSSKSESSRGFTVVQHDSAWRMSETRKSCLVFCCC